MLEFLAFWSNNDLNKNSSVNTEIRFIQWKLVNVFLLFSSSFVILSLILIVLEFFIFSKTD